MMASLYVPFVLHHSPLKQNAPVVLDPVEIVFISGFAEPAHHHTSSHVYVSRPTLLSQRTRPFSCNELFEQEDICVCTAVKTYMCIWTRKRTRREPLTLMVFVSDNGLGGGAARCYRNHDDRPQRPPVAAGAWGSSLRALLLVL